MRTHAPFLLAAALAATFSGFAHAQSDRVAGCYDLAFGPWTPPEKGDTENLYAAPPPRIRLDSVPSPESGSERPVLKVHPAPGSPPSVHAFATWRRVEGDSIRLDFSTGFSGVWMQFAVGHGTLRGRAHTAWDFPAEPQTAPVVARRVPCDAPPRPEWASYRRFPTEVRLEGGRTVALGKTLTEGGLPLEESSREVRGRPVGLFAGATRIEVRRVAAAPGERQRILQVDLYYPAATDVPRLVERFTAALGEPTVRGDEAEASGDAAWFGRESKVMLWTYPSAAGGEQVRVLLTSWES